MVMAYHLTNSIVRQPLLRSESFRKWPDALSNHFKPEAIAERNIDFTPVY